MTATKRIAPLCPPGAFERLLQQHADRVWDGLPDRPIVKMTERQIEYSFTGWSAALFRHPVRRQAVAEMITWARLLNPDANCSAIALSVVQMTLSKTIDYQRAWHAAAQSLDLVVGAVCHDLPPARLRIDRSLLDLLEPSGVKIRGVMEQFYAPENREELSHHTNTVCLNREHFWTVEHEGTGSPILSTWTSLRSAEFDGTRLEIPQALPETILVGASGRQLGEIIETGVPHLDARRIQTAVGRDPERRGFWHSTTNTGFCLEPDWVELG